MRSVSPMQYRTPPKRKRPSYQGMAVLESVIVLATLMPLLYLSWSVAWLYQAYHQFNHIVESELAFGAAPIMQEVDLANEAVMVSTDPEQLFIRKINAINTKVCQEILHQEHCGEVISSEISYLGRRYTATGRRRSLFDHNIKLKDPQIVYIGSFTNELLSTLPIVGALSVLTISVKKNYHVRGDAQWINS